MIAGNPIMVGGKKPSGSININANGTYDVTEKASAVVNVVSAPVLLWTNESPRSSFSEKTLSFTGTWTGYLIETVAGIVEEYGTFNDVYAISYIPVEWDSRQGPGGGASTRTGTYSTYEVKWFRILKGVTENSIRFSGSGSIHDSYNESYAGGKVAIPTRIWGVHFTVDETL